MSGVSPRSNARLGSAPACSSTLTSDALPFWLAIHSGVAPRSFAAFTLAPARNEQASAVEIIAMAGPMQRGRAVGLGRVDVGALLDQRPQGVAVAVLRRGHQRRAHRICGGAGGGARAGDEQQHQRRPHQSDTVSIGSLPVLPPTRSTGTSILSMSVTSRLAIEGAPV